MAEKTVIYFEKPGKGNTEALFAAVRARAAALGIRQVVAASTHGYTARQAKTALAGAAQVIAVTISPAYAEEGWTMKETERAQLQEAGIMVLTCPHALGGDISEGLQAPGPQSLAAKVLYRFSQGMKVAVEVALMAADAGLLDMGREVIAVGGTGEGADTAIVVKPSYSRSFQDFQILEIIAKPRQP